MRIEKKTAVGVAAAAAAALAITGGTFATFSDTEEAPNPSITAGTLDLTTGGEEQSESFAIEDVAPGYSSEEAGEGKTIQYENEGSIDGDLTLTVDYSTDEVGCNDPEIDAEKAFYDDESIEDCGNDTELDEQLYAEIIGPDGTVAGEDLVGHLKGETVDAGELGGGESRSYTVHFSVPDSAGNEIQSDKVTLEITADLEQNETQAD
ncbi:camelysin. Metallo peptidase. MEROPS family M73 [Haloechinothrix alba]|uniref:Camelysin. Metallo peptidase. MEROPS family M73 n=1 Tax=Haloechinothrix alba TaxID=664784 RepID=A0A238Y1I1_9PSEU|nr:TasA family protein [Haloechinothrix alba]SNR64668.1 camelysin. Metallo peptidase. MEROPS family M73 [Haloechinothrix alba]